uniref:Uncharacterized protein n=1 Tax=viral metagenome TaxID=1070528 RepID=A0A6C0E0C1_9ZZZZ
MSRKRNDFGSKSDGSGIKSDDSWSYLLDSPETIEKQKKQKEKDLFDNNKNLLNIELETMIGVLKKS